MNIQLEDDKNVIASSNEYAYSGLYNLDLQFAHGMEENRILTCTSCDKFHMLSFWIERESVTSSKFSHSHSHS